MSIFVLDVYSMKKVIRIPEVHSFPVTAIDFNHDATLVLSGSADGTIVAVKVPITAVGNNDWSGIYLAIMFLAVMLLIMAILPFETFVESHREL
jgi:hypothetical protein